MLINQKYVDRFLDVVVSNASNPKCSVITINVDTRPGLTVSYPLPPSMLLGPVGLPSALPHNQVAVHQVG
jgi:hypothetical protein